MTSKQKLLALGYTEEQANKVILRGSSKKTVAALINHHKQLVELQFSHEQIVKIASHNGGRKNLEAVMKIYKALNELGFNAEQIVRMVSHNGGSSNLAAVTANYGVLIELKFGAEQIVRMVSHDGGSKNLTIVIANCGELKLLGFNAEQIVRMVSHNGGSKNLEVVTANCDSLKRLGFEAEQIVRMVAHEGGSKNLEALLKIDSSTQLAALLSRRPEMRSVFDVTALSYVRTLSKPQSYMGACLKDKELTLSLNTQPKVGEGFSLQYALMVIYDIDSAFRPYFERPDLTAPLALRLTDLGESELKDAKAAIVKIKSAAQKMVFFYPLALTVAEKLFIKDSQSPAQLRLNNGYSHRFYVRRIKDWLNKIYPKTILSSYFEKPAVTKAGECKPQLKRPGTLTDASASDLFLTIMAIEHKCQKRSVFAEFCENVSLESIDGQRAKLSFNKLCDKLGSLNKGISQPLFERCLKEKFITLLNRDKEKHYVEEEDGVFDLVLNGEDLIVSRQCTFEEYIKTARTKKGEPSDVGDVEGELEAICFEFNGVLSDSPQTEQSVIFEELGAPPTFDNRENNNNANENDQVSRLLTDDELQLLFSAEPHNLLWQHKYAAKGTSNDLVIDALSNNWVPGVGR